MFRPQIFLRSLIIFLSTIFFGTLLCTLVLTGGYISFGDIFFTGLILTSVFSIPNIFILYFGLNKIYKKRTYWRKVWKKLLLLSTLLCIIPFVVFTILQLTDYLKIGFLEMGIGLLLLSLPYILLAFVFLLLTNYFFDRRFPLHDFIDERYDDDLLDDNMIKEEL